MPSSAPLRRTNSRARRAASLARAALVGVDVIGESENLFLITVVVLKGDLKIDTLADALEINHLVVKRRFVFVQMLDKRDDSAGVMKLVFLFRTFILDSDQDAFIQEGEF